MRARCFCFTCNMRRKHRADIIQNFSSPATALCQWGATCPTQNCLQSIQTSKHNARLAPAVHCHESFARRCSSVFILDTEQDQENKHIHQKQDPCHFKNFFRCRDFLHPYIPEPRRHCHKMKSRLRGLVPTTGRWAALQSWTRFHGQRSPSCH